MLNIDEKVGVRSI